MPPTLACFHCLTAGAFSRPGIFRKEKSTFAKQKCHKKETGSCGGEECRSRKLRKKGDYRFFKTR